MNYIQTSKISGKAFYKGALIINIKYLIYIFKLRKARFKNSKFSLFVPIELYSIIYFFVAQKRLRY